MSRKKILIVLVIIFLAIVGFFFLKQGGLPLETPSPLPAKPSFPNSLVGGTNIKTSVTKEAFFFPEKLPLVVVKAAPPLTEDEIFVLAQKMGFAEDNYLLANDVSRGKVFIFRRERESLSFYLNSSEINYVSGIAPRTTISPLADKDLIEISENFLKSNFFSSGSSSVFFSSINYLREEEEGLSVSARENANIFLVNFSPIKSDIKFVEINPLSSNLSVWLTPSGQIIKSEIKIISQATFSLEEVPIKNYEDFIASLPVSVVISLADGNIYPGDLPEGSIEQIMVDQVEIAYYKGADRESFYQPVFLLTGTSEVKNYGTLPVSLYLPAVKGL